MLKPIEKRLTWYDSERDDVVANAYGLVVEYSPEEVINEAGLKYMSRGPSYVTGPIVDRLYAYEMSGLEPDNLRESIFAKRKLVVENWAFDCRYEGTDVTHRKIKYRCPHCRTILYVQHRIWAKDESCGHNYVVGAQTKHCHECGQRLDWEVDNEI